MMRAFLVSFFLLISFSLITKPAYGFSRSYEDSLRGFWFLVGCFGWSFLLCLAMFAMIWFLRRADIIKNSKLRSEFFISQVVADYANDKIGMPWKMQGEFLVQNPNNANICYLHHTELMPIAEATFKQINEEKVCQFAVAYIIEDACDGQEGICIDYLIGNDIESNDTSCKAFIICYIIALIIPLLVIFGAFDTFIVMYPFSGYLIGLVVSLLCLWSINKGICCKCLGQNKRILVNQVASDADLRRFEGYVTSVNGPEIRIVGDYQMWKRNMRNESCDVI